MTAGQRSWRGETGKVARPHRSGPAQQITADRPSFRAALGRDDASLLKGRRAIKSHETGHCTHESQTGTEANIGLNVSIEKETAGGFLERRSSKNRPRPLSPIRRA